MTDSHTKATGPSEADKKQEEDENEAESEDLLDEGEVVGDRFVILEKLQSGSFGQVYLAMDKNKEEMEVALKIEKPRPAGKRSLCAHEAEILKRCQGMAHIPEMYAFNTDPPLPFIALQLMSCTLSELRRSCPSKFLPRFSLATAIRVGVQSFTAVQELHGVGVVHRDIKPSNFMLGSTERTKRCVYLLDFGLSRAFRKASGEPIPPRNQPGFVGSTRYASLAAHDGRELGRGDDLMSLFYVFVEMRQGKLPWRNVGARAVVAIMKRATKIEQMCLGMPQAVIDMGGLIERLKYADDPDYGKIDALFRTVAEENQIDLVDGSYDWEERFIQILREDEKFLKQPLPVPGSPVAPPKDGNP